MPSMLQDWSDGWLRFILYQKGLNDSSVIRAVCTDILQVPAKRIHAFFWCPASRCCFTSPSFPLPSRDIADNANASCMFHDCRLQLSLIRILVSSSTLFLCPYIFPWTDDGMYTIWGLNTCTLVLHDLGVAAMFASESNLDLGKTCRKTSGRQCRNLLLLLNGSIVCSIRVTSQEILSPTCPITYRILSTVPRVCSHDNQCFVDALIYIAKFLNCIESI